MLQWRICSELRAPIWGQVTPAFTPGAPVLSRVASNLIEIQPAEVFCLAYTILLFEFLNELPAFKNQEISYKIWTSLSRSSGQFGITAPAFPHDSSWHSLSSSCGSCCLLGPGPAVHCCLAQVIFWPQPHCNLLGRTFPRCCSGSSL